LVVGVEPGMNLPLVGGAELREGGAAGGRAEADELERVTRGCTVAGEVHNGVAVRLPGMEDEQVVAGAADQRVDACAAIDAVVATVTLDVVVLRVAETVDVVRALQVEILDIVSELIADAGIDRVAALAQILCNLVEA